MIARMFRLGWNSMPARVAVHPRGTRRTRRTRFMNSNKQSLLAPIFEFLNSDGVLVGTLMSEGLAGAGTPPPGSPPGQSQGNNAIMGGTGAFLGARGASGQIVTPQTVAARTASITEDPANRRANGGG